MTELFFKLMRYAVTGGIAALIDAGGFALLIKMDLNVVPASIFSFCVAALVNYRLTSHFVFNHSATINRFVLFMFAALTGLTINVGITLAGIFFFGLPPLVAKLGGIGIAFLVNFGLNLQIVFRTRT
jgi:putative flippase GtrA